MKKRQAKKLKLTTETLRQLNPDQILQAEGGVDNQDPGGPGPTQGLSYCNPCTTSYTLFQAQCQ